MKSLQLERQRTRLSNIRTLLAFIATSIMSLAIALLLYHFDIQHYSWVATVLAVLSAIILTVGIVIFVLVNRTVASSMEADNE